MAAATTPATTGKPRKTSRNAADVAREKAREERAAQEAEKARHEAEEAERKAEAEAIAERRKGLFSAVVTQAREERERKDAAAKLGKEHLAQTKHKTRQLDTVAAVALMYRDRGIDAELRRRVRAERGAAARMGPQDHPDWEAIQSAVRDALMMGNAPSNETGEANAWTKAVATEGKNLATDSEFEFCEDLAGYQKEFERLEIPHRTKLAKRYAADKTAAEAAADERKALRKAVGRHVAKLLKLGANAVREGEATPDVIGKDVLRELAPLALLIGDAESETRPEPTPRELDS